MLQIVKGDIFNANTDYICQQVNCKNVMGAGFAKLLYSKWPEVKYEYHKFCNLSLNLFDLLGEIQIVKLHDIDMAVINVFGQLDYGRNKKITYTDYNALVKAFDKINHLCASKTVSFPYGFGCGLANGDWMEVEKLMLNHLLNCDVKIFMKE